MAGHAHLYIPGPTNVPERVRMAMNVSMQDRRAPDFPDLTKPLFAKVAKVFRNAGGRVFICPSSGTGAWEAAIQNTLSPGNRVLMSRFGQFSHLWVDMAQRLGLDVDAIDRDWGEGVPVELNAERLRADRAHAIKAVFVTHNETATGVCSDVAAVRRALDEAGHPVLLMVDRVSSVGSIPFDQDAWRVDACVSGSQKGFMLPAGLGLLSVSAKALEASRTAGIPRTYFAFGDQVAANDSGYFPYTPPTQLLRGLDVSCDMLLEEVLEAVWARHARLAEAVRRAVWAWDLRLCAKERRGESDLVSAVVVPEGMVCTALSVAEMAMIDCGLGVRPGSGVGAAVAHLAATSPATVAKAA